METTIKSIAKFQRIWRQRRWDFHLEHAPCEGCKRSVLVVSGYEVLCDDCYDYREKMEEETKWWP